MACGGCGGCGGPSRARTADSGCIGFTGTGSLGDPLIATPIIDPASPLPVACGPAGLSFNAPDLYVSGGVAPGSLAPIAVDTVGAGPDWANYCGGFLTPYGPQADILITNPTTATFALNYALQPAQAVYNLDPGARLNIGHAVDSTGINLPPAPITPGATFYGGVPINNYEAVITCGATYDPPQLETPTGVVLAPGDFVWLSVITLVQLTGTAGGSLVQFIFGAGPRINIRGVRL